MEALKILVVEDDLLLAEQIVDDLVNFGYVITDSASNSDDALRAFRKRLPDMVIMDINLEDSKLDGIDLALEFNKIVKVPVIFLTALGGTETVERATKVNPAYYLIKPCNSTQLKIALEMSISNFINQEKALVEHSLQYHAPSSCVLYSSTDYVFAKKNDRFIRIEIADIIWVEAMGMNVRIFTEYTNVVVTAKLKSFIEQVPHKSLVRVHRSYVVNRNKIVAFDKSRVFVRFEEKQKDIPVGGSFRDSFQGMFPKLKSD